MLDILWSMTRSRRSKEDMQGLRLAIYDVCAQQHPTTCRSVFYQLVASGVIEKTEAEYNQTVIRLLGKMRLDGDLPWDWIVDGTRWMHKSRSHSSMQDALRDTTQLYRRELWAEQPYYVEVWLEKEALAGVLFDVTDEFDVPLMVARGYSSLTFLHDAASTIRHRIARGHTAIIYNIGDHDPSGVNAWQKVVERLEDFIGPPWTQELVCERLAVTPEQIQEMQLPTRPTKRSDTRSKTFQGESVEVDAIPTPVLQGLVRTAIEDVIDDDEWERTLLIEQAERESATALVQTFSPPAA